MTQLSQSLNLGPLKKLKLFHFQTPKFTSLPKSKIRPLSKHKKLAPYLISKFGSLILAPVLTIWLIVNQMNPKPKLTYLYFAPVHAFLVIPSLLYVPTIMPISIMFPTLHFMPFVIPIV